MSMKAWREGEIIREDIHEGLQGINPVICIFSHHGIYDFAMKESDGSHI